MFTRGVGIVANATWRGDNCCGEAPDDGDDGGDDDDDEEDGNDDDDNDDEDDDADEGGDSDCGMLTRRRLIGEATGDAAATLLVSALCLS